MEIGQGGDTPGTIDDVAQFLIDNREADHEEESPTPEEPDEDNSEGAEEDAPAEDSEDEESGEPKQTSGLKFKVPLKGDDGQETTVEVDEKELIAGYTRHADYTRKAMALGEREREVTQVVAQRLEEGRTYYMQQAQAARTAVLQLAGLKTPQEMAALAHSDPSQWVAEQQRHAAVGGYLSQLDQQIQAQEHQRQAAQQQQNAQLGASAWGVLGNEGFNKDKLAELYRNVGTKYAKYGLTFDQVAQNMHPGLVMLMKDAVEYQGLKDQKAQVTAKVKEAPKLPAQRQSVPKNEQRNQQLNKRFASGKAKLGDLAAWIANN